MTLDRIAARIAEARGWKRRLVAFAAGAVGALAMPPFNLWPVLFISLTVCVWLIDGAKAGARPLRSAALDGWWFGFGYFLAGLWWIGTAFLVEADIFGWLLPLPVLGLPAGLAVFTALGFWLAALIWRRSPWRPLGFALGLGTAEFLRGVVLTGFPWNAFGYALADQLWFGQAASIVGVEGLTFAALFLFSAPAGLADTTRDRYGPTAVAVLALAGLAVFGAVRVATTEVALRPSPELVLVQPAVPRDARFRPSAGPDILDLYLRMSRESPEALGGEGGGVDADGVETLLVWPESAFPFLIERTPDALAAMAASLPRRTTLLTGAARIADGPNGEPEFYNSVMTIEDGVITRTFDKSHLVPFGEYLPLKKLMQSIGLEELIRRPGGFVAGATNQENVSAAGIKFRPLICYEAVFPAEIVTSARPDALLNVTDDAWFGRTPGPYQHFAISKVRSIEQGLPLLRVANSGISAIVDPVGRVVSFLPLGDKRTLRARLPVALPPTIYARIGRGATLAFALLLAAFYPFATRRRV